MEFTYKKTIMERYELREKENGEWAVIEIDEHGYFEADSNYGSYKHYWNTFDQSFKELLVRISNDASYLYAELHNPKLKSNNDYQCKNFCQYIMPVFGELLEVELFRNKHLK